MNQIGAETKEREKERERETHRRSFKINEKESQQ
jgi:hypothetical protein